jgi:hypothetical protein
MGGKCDDCVRWYRFIRFTDNIGRMFLCTHRPFSSDDVRQIKHCVLTLQEGNWTVEIPIDLSAVRDGPVIVPRWLISADPTKFAPSQCGRGADVT